MIRRRQIFRRPTQLGCAIDINPNENYYLQYATGYRLETLGARRESY